jgi:hypothetical protein
MTQATIAQQRRALSVSTVNIIKYSLPLVVESNLPSTNLGND